MGGLVCGFAGMVFLLTAVGMWKDQQPIPGGVVTTGEIVGFERVRQEEGGTPFRYPVVEFRANQDSTQRFTVQSNDETSKEGYRVSVRYDPQNPARAQLATPPDELLWAAFAAFGVFNWFAVLIFWLRGRRARPGSAHLLPAP